MKPKKHKNIITELSEKSLVSKINDPIIETKPPKRHMHGRNKRRSPVKTNMANVVEMLNQP